MRRVSVKINKKVILGIFASLTIVVLLGIVVLGKPISYHLKSEVKYVSKEFDVTVERYYVVGKNYTYHCTDNVDGKTKYIFLDYVSKKFFIVEETQGVTEKEAINLVLDAGQSTNVSELLIFNPGTFSKLLEDGSVNDSMIIDKLRWHLYQDSLNGSIYVNFQDGELYYE